MKKLLIPFLIFAMLLSLSGCSLFQKDPKEIVTEAFDNLNEVDYYSYDLSFEGEMSDGIDGVALYAIFDGIEDNSDPDQLKFTANFDIGFSVPDYEGQSLKGELRSDNDFIYFVINEISDFDGAFTPELTASFIKLWYKMDLQSEVVASIIPFYQTEENDMTEEQKGLNELLEDTDFLTDFEYVSGDDGRDAYTASLDKDAVTDFFVELADLYGRTVDENDIEEMEVFMSTIEMGLDLYVDTAENVLVSVDGFMTINDPSGLTGNFDFGMNIDNLHQPVEVSAPENATEFDPTMLVLFAAAFMEGFLGGMDPAMADPAMTDPTMTDVPRGMPQGDY